MDFLFIFQFISVVFYIVLIVVLDHFYNKHFEELEERIEQLERSEQIHIDRFGYLMSCIVKLEGDDNE